MRPRIRRDGGRRRGGARAGTGSRGTGKGRRPRAQRATLETVRRQLEIRDRLVGIVGHDLRTPLSAVIMSVAVLLRRKDLSPEQARVVARIGSSSVRMARMVRDLLDFSRLTNEGAIPISPRLVDVAAVVRRAVSELRAVHPDRGIVLEQAPAVARVDPERLGQVVSNLVGNALEHGPAEASVHVRVGAEGREAVIRVHNDGPAIHGDLSELFEPFRRGSSAAGCGGAGLGLYIVREIVRAHGGTVEVSSSDAEGTTFTVRLPTPTTTGRPAPGG